MLKHYDLTSTPSGPHHPFQSPLLPTALALREESSLSIFVMLTTPLGTWFVLWTFSWNIIFWCVSWPHITYSLRLSTFWSFLILPPPSTMAMQAIQLHSPCFITFSRLPRVYSSFEFTWSTRDLPRVLSVTDWDMYL